MHYLRAENSSLLRSAAEPVFNIRAGVQAEDALVHASLYLKAAYATADEVRSRTKLVDQGLPFHIRTPSVRTAKALQEARAIRHQYDSIDEMSSELNGEQSEQGQRQVR